jgi:hypothetical protein
MVLIEGLNTVLVKNVRIYVEVRVVIACYWYHGIWPSVIDSCIT